MENEEEEILAEEEEFSYFNYITGRLFIFYITRLFN